MTNPANPCGRAWRETEHYMKFGAVHAPRIRGRAFGHATAPQRAGDGKAIPSPARTPLTVAAIERARGATPQ